MAAYDLKDLVDDVTAVVRDTDADDTRCERITPFLRHWMDGPVPLLPEQYTIPCDDRACGHLLYTDPAGEYFIISVVFPAGTSSGVHYHGAWGVIGILQGTDEETKYARDSSPEDIKIGQPCELNATDKIYSPPGTITYLQNGQDFAYRYNMVDGVWKAPQSAFVSVARLAGSDSRPIRLSEMVGFGPFALRGEQNGFWQYGKSLCVRFITSMLFSGVLYAGLAIALAALNNLFGVDVPAKRYLELWVFLAGMFAVWFFLAGVPEDLDGLESSTDYPKVVKIFAQYILLPLGLVYLVILYAYVGKILIEWSWPRGWVSGLILGYSATGMVLFMLLHPVRAGSHSAPPVLWWLLLNKRERA